MALISCTIYEVFSVSSKYQPNKGYITTFNGINKDFTLNTKDTFAIVLSPNELNNRHGESYGNEMLETLRNTPGITIVYEGPVCYNINYIDSGPRNKLVLFEYDEKVPVSTVP